MHILSLVCRVHAVEGAGRTHRPVLPPLCSPRARPQPLGMTGEWGTLDVSGALATWRDRTPAVRACLEASSTDAERRTEGSECPAPAGSEHIIPGLWPAFCDLRMRRRRRCEVPHTAGNVHRPGVAQDIRAQRRPEQRANLFVRSLSLRRIQVHGGSSAKPRANALANASTSSLVAVRRRTSAGATG